MMNTTEQKTAKLIVNQDARIQKLDAENKRFRAALKGVMLAGHNDDCLFCARKDVMAQRGLEKPEQDNER